MQSVLAYGDIRLTSVASVDTTLFSEGGNTIEQLGNFRSVETLLGVLYPLWRTESGTGAITVSANAQWGFDSKAVTLVDEDPIKIAVSQALDSTNTYVGKIIDDRLGIITTGEEFPEMPVATALDGANALAQTVRDSLAALATDLSKNAMTPVRSPVRFPRQAFVGVRIAHRYKERGGDSYVDLLFGRSQPHGNSAREALFKHFKVEGFFSFPFDAASFLYLSGSATVNIRGVDSTVTNDIDDSIDSWRLTVSLRADELIRKIARAITVK
jgi:hypothetical protein